MGWHVRVLRLVRTAGGGEDDVLRPTVRAIGSENGLDDVEAYTRSRTPPR
ncbi:hypothetical protein Nans01_43620 [Nocardiopsis ansamitocini]|uniref:Uncharacterized protein n=1 Tax=Nocardiopsis ansamitocini TaxID=1670832 RepID=A0A9W6UIJ8_9ACTN|nr:hypothetical protein Nans01_43620 [Nocardiopsis ansamitocini]